MIFVGLGDRMRGEPGDRQCAMGSSPLSAASRFRYSDSTAGTSALVAPSRPKGVKREHVVLIGRHRDGPAAQADSLRNITPQQIAAYQNVRIDAGRAPNFALPSATRGSSLLTESAVSSPPPLYPRGDQARTRALWTAMR